MTARGARWGSAALAVALLLAACGDGGGNEVDADAGTADLSGIEVTVPTAATFVRGGPGTAVVDGLAGEPGRETAKVWLDDGEERRELAAPDMPLNAVAAWFAGDRLVLDGIDCPAFSREALLANSEGTDLRGICGSADRRTIAVDLETGEWESLGTRPIAELTSPHLPAAPDGSVLMGGDRLLRADGRDVGLGGLPAEDEQTQVDICSSGAAPLAVVRAGGDLAIPSPSRPAEDQPAETVTLFRLIGTEWRATELDVTDGLANQSFRGCTREGLLMAGVTELEGELVARTVVADSGSGATIAPLDLGPVSGAGLPSLRVDVAGTILAGDDEADWFALEEGGWRSLGEVDLTEGRAVLTAGDQVLVVRNVFDRPVAIEVL